MMDTTLLFDMVPTGAGIGVFLTVAFLFVVLAVAFVVFKFLKKSVKMGIRLLIVAVVLAIAVAGSLSVWWLTTSKPTRPGPPRTSQSK